MGRAGHIGRGQATCESCTKAIFLHNLGFANFSTSLALRRNGRAGGTQGAPPPAPGQPPKTEGSTVVNAGSVAGSNVPSACACIVMMALVQADWPGQAE